MADTAIETLREEIKDFLKGADLSLASWKKVRAHLNDKFHCDFSSRKDEINEVVMEVLTELEGDDRKDSEDDDDEPDDDSDDNYSDESEKPKKRKLPPRKPAAKKRRVKGSDSEDESEEISEEEDSEEERKKRKRRTLNGNAKTRKSVGGARGGAGGATGVKTARATGYLKKLKLSPELSEVMGEEFMARNEVVKKMYAVVKQRDLLDPKNRQFAILDEQLQNVFGQKRVRMFGMLKLLGKHFSSAD